PPLGGEAPSEPDVRVSPHPAQALKSPFIKGRLSTPSFSKRVVISDTSEFLPWFSITRLINGVRLQSDWANSISFH
ncbi:MAG: hypothetical protein WCP34_14740, partial [Pseudomonadota bacterium]